MNRKYLGSALLALVAPGLGQAQELVNQGTSVYVTPGSTLYVGGALTNAAGELRNDGTVRVTGATANAGTLTLGGGIWQALGDFTNTGTLTPGTGRLAFVGAADQTLRAGGALLPTVEVAQTAPGSRLLLPADATVGGLILTSGLVRTAPAATLTLPDGATVRGEASGRYVQGNLRVQRAGVAGVVDFGHGLRLDAAGQALGTVAVTRTAGLQLPGSSYATAPDGRANGIDRIWTVTAARQPTAPVELALSWLPDDDNGLTSFAQARVWAQPDTAQPWTAVGAAADASATRRLPVSTTQLARFTVSNAGNPLPVELVDFTAERRGPDALLRWTTAQEAANDHFDVEASTDGRAFQRVGTLAGHGSTTQHHDYQLTDPNLARYGTAVVYYRLRQVDQGGGAQLSAVRTVRVPAAAELTLQSWPNPFGSDGLRLRVQAPTAGPADATLHDAAGRVLLRNTWPLAAGSTQLQWPEAAQLPPGVYLLLVRQGRQHVTQKIVRSE